MLLPFPFGYPKPAIWFVPTTSNAGERLREEFGAWRVDGKRELVTTMTTPFRTAQDDKRLRSSVGDWREVWALDHTLLNPLLTKRFPEPIPVEWPVPFPLTGQLCPARDWPYYSYLVIYEDRRAAMADLARYHDGVAAILELVNSPSTQVRSAAQAVLNGDQAALLPLAKALEGVGDPRAADIRSWQAAS